MILLTGATGTTGRALAAQLRRQGARFRVLSRDPRRARAVLGEDTDVVTGDLADQACLSAAFAGADRLFLLTSADLRQVELHKNALEAAARVGVRHVVRVSALGADPEAAFAFGRLHGQSEHDLERSGLAYTHLRPHFFMQNMLGFAPTVLSAGALFAPMRRGEIGLVDARDVAEVAAAALTEPGHEGQAYTITGPQALGFQELADKLAAVTGRRVDYFDVPPATAKSAMVSSGLPEWLAEAMLEMYAVFASGQGALVTDVVRRVLRRAPRSFDHFAREHAAAFIAPAAKA